MNQLSSFIAICAVCVAACAPARGDDHSRVVATVGIRIISEADLLRKIEVEHCYGDTAATIEQVCVQIVNNALEREVLRTAYSIEASPLVLRERAQWVDRNTRDPIGLLCIKRVCGADTAAYYRMFIEPALVNPRLHALFEADTTIHRSRCDSIRSMWTAIRSDASAFDRIHHETGSARRMRDTAAAPMAPPAMMRFAFADSILSVLKPGEIRREIYEDGEGYFIIRLDSCSSTAYHLSTIHVAKYSFDTWFQEQVSRAVPIHFIDPDLEREVRKTFAGLWWLQK
jgi:hypothetical protein